MTLALARKWRPKAFSELVGQDHVVRALSNALDTQRLHHAYLFSGSRGIGKTTLARILAKALNCETGITSQPCGTCRACREIDEGRFLDLLELDAASHTQVDNMREILENAMYAPSAARFKVYIIDEVHMLSKSAFNAMLKTLEEPPAHVKFILATTDPQKVPLTVLSRCLQFNLKQIPTPLIAGQLRNVLEKEQIDFEPAALAWLAKAAQGSLRDALSLTDQAIAHGAGKVKEAEVREMLGAIDPDYLFSLLDALAQHDASALIAQADAIASRNLPADSALQDLARVLLNIALAQIGPETLGDDDPQRERITGLAKVFSAEEVQLLYQIAVQGRNDLPFAPDEIAGFTMTLLRMLAFTPESDLSSGPVQENHGDKMRVRSQTAVNPQPSIPGLPPAGAGLNPFDCAQDRPQSPVSPLPGQAPAYPLPGRAADFDWFELSTKMKGMARQLAERCAMKSFNNDTLDLSISERDRHLLSKPYQDKLRSALEEQLKRKIRINYSVSGEPADTPAQQNARTKQANEEAAIESVSREPLVKKLMESCDARLVSARLKYRTSD